MPNPIVVLVVDDDAGIREFFQIAIPEVIEGCRVVAAASADSAIEMIKGGLAFDLLLTDLTMPGKHGDQLIAELRQMGVAQPAVIMTGHVKPPRPLLTAARVLYKPVTIEEIAETVRMLTSPPALPLPAVG